MVKLQKQATGKKRASAMQLFKIVSLPVLLMALSACGGGGSGSSPAVGIGGNPGGGNGGGGGTGSNAPYNTRVVDTVLDFDNNGQMDARIDFVYYPDGRVNVITYTYIGDGTPDIYNPFYTASVTQADSEFSYDANGNLSGFKLTIQDSLLGTTINDVIYTLSNGQLVQTVATIITANLPPITLNGTMNYVNGLPSLYVVTDNFGGQSSRTYTFSNNQLQQSILSIGQVTNPTTAVYSWNPDGSLDKIDYADGLINWTEDLTFTNGLLTQRDFTYSNSPSPGNTNVSWLISHTNGMPSRVDYDLNMDGFIDGSQVVNYESGPCTPVYAYIDLDESQTGFDGIPGSPNGLSYCG